MEQCPNCGNEIRPTARFCTSCGFRIPERSLAGDSADGGAQSTADSMAGGTASHASGWVTTRPEPATPVEPEAAPEPQPVAWASDWQPAPDPAASETRTFEPATTAPPEAAVPMTFQGSVPDVIAENSINDMAENRVNIALFHIERLKQLVPDITGWSEQQASSVDAAIAALETALQGREDQGGPYESLRETLKSARRSPRDIDVMVALTDRAAEIQDLLDAHDQYSRGVREALFAIKPAAVNYVSEVKRRPPRRRTSRKAAPTQETTPEPTLQTGVADATEIAAQQE